MTTQAAPSSPTVDATFARPVHPTTPIRARRSDPAAPVFAGSQELARTRLAAARHAVDDIQAALSRMARGTYGRCQQCGQRITADRLQASPTARWCVACQG